MATTTTTETKICTKCGVEKPVSEFGWKDKKAGRIRSSCKACENARAKKYREANPEKVKAATAKWAKEHRKQRNAYMRKWHKQHKEDYNAKSKAYYEERREGILKQKAEYYEQNRDAIRKKQNRNYHQDRKYKKLTHEQQLKLFEDNRGLVFHMAKKYGCDNELYDDMIQAGFEGLWKGVLSLGGSYKPRKSALSTWLCWYIQHEFSNFVYKASNKSGLSAAPATICRARKKIETDECSTQEHNLLAYSLSLDAPLDSGDKESDSVAALLGVEDEQYDGISEAVQQLLSGLNDDDRTLICKYFGIGCESRPLTVLGEEYGVSKQTVLNHINRALARLRAMPNISELAVYLS